MERSPDMSKPLSVQTMEVVALADGRYGVRISAPDALPHIAGEFASKEEADAWILQRGLIEDERAEGSDTLKPGPSLDVG
jgi:hypothetical protein